MRKSLEEKPEDDNAEVAEAIPDTEVCGNCEGDGCNDCDFTGELKIKKSKLLDEFQ